MQIDRGRQQAQPTRPFRPRARPPPMDVRRSSQAGASSRATDDEALFGRGRPPQLLTVAVRRGRRARWEPVGASNSRPLRAVRDGVRASSWRLDPDSTPEPRGRGATDPRDRADDGQRHTGRGTAARARDLPRRQPRAAARIRQAARGLRGTRGQTGDAGDRALYRSRSGGGCRSTGRCSSRSER